jgi:agarase
LDRPAIIGEFHFGALDRGMFHTGLQATGSQAERAAAFARYVQSVADHPNFVGAHWFQYTDQAITGRPRDGENYNIGFVNVVDTPYPEMVNAAREMHEGIYPRRLR